MRMQRKLNKKTIIIAIILICAMIISVFAITDTIKVNKANNENIAPFTYRMVVAYFEYWDVGDTYLADIPNKEGIPIRTNIGQNPANYIEWDYWFPVATIPGNYKIEDIMNYKDYRGTWEELGYNATSQLDIETYYMNTAVIENKDAVIGASNTTVRFQASFKPLPPNQANKVGERLYRCYIAIVIKYKNLDYVEPPEEPEEPEEPENPGDGDKMVYVHYKDKETDANLSPLKKVPTSTGKKIVESSVKIDGFKCTSVTIKGKSTRTLNQNSIDEVFGKGDYMTPADGYLVDVTFNYEKSTEKPSDSWCDPEFDASSKDKTIKMKRKDFDNAKDLYFNDVYINLRNFKGGKKRDGTVMPGQHGFEYFDLYLKSPGEKVYYFSKYNIYDTYVYQAINIPKSKFTSLNPPENTLYGANIEATIGAFCLCGGFGADKTNFNLYVEIEANKPPEALYKYATIKNLPSGTETRVYGKAYVGKDVVIDNYCNDPNGLTDIDFVEFTLTNKNKLEQVKRVKSKMTILGQYEPDKIDDFNGTPIIFEGVGDNGSLRLKFMNTDEWEVTVYVQDTEGLSDSYTDIIKPEELSLKPTAVISDAPEYRYPIGIYFNGKQNRIIKIDSNRSYVASWLRDMDVKIDHSQDMWQIEPLDGQDINSIKFERKINKIISGNILNVRYEPLDIKMMFKEPGRYKVRLQVTDTEGNVSDWEEEIIKISEDLPPVVTGNISPTYLRNSSGIASIAIKNISPKSLDGDNVIMEVTGKLKYKYDSNNDGSFADETIREIPLIKNGSTYEATLQTSDLGKYQFIVNVRETFGQECLEEFIDESDVKKASAVLNTHVDNIEPDVTLFEIWTTEN